MVAWGCAAVTQRYTVTNNIGSTHIVLDESGNTKQRIMYDPFGKPRNVYTLSLATSIQDWSGFVSKDGFTSHEHMYELDLIHMNGRVYDPTIGRFLQADIIVQAPKQMLSYNRYAYVWNNPLGYTDPSGYTVDGAYDSPAYRDNPDNQYGTSTNSTSNNARSDRDSSSIKDDSYLNSTHEPYDGYPDTSDDIYLDVEQVGTEFISLDDTLRDLWIRSFDTSAGITFTLDAPFSLMDKVFPYFGIDKTGVPDIGLSGSLQMQSMHHPDGFDIGLVMTRRAIGGAGVVFKGVIGFEMNTGSIQEQAGNGWSGSIFVVHGGATWNFDDSGTITGGGVDLGLGVEAAIARETSSTLTLFTFYTPSGCSKVVC